MSKVDICLMMKEIGCDIHTEHGKKLFAMARISSLVCKTLIKYKVSETLLTITYSQLSYFCEQLSLDPEEVVQFSNTCSNVSSAALHNRHVFGGYGGIWCSRYRSLSILVRYITWNSSNWRFLSDFIHRPVSVRNTGSSTLAVRASTNEITHPTFAVRDVARTK